jgi:uncharacterized LabA/DUF88 family protein
MSIITFDKNDRVMIFVDLMNMKKSVTKDSSYTDLDYIALARILKGPRKLVGAYVFDSKNIVDSEDRTKRFHDMLRYNGFRVIARDSYDSEAKIQKEVDVAMAVQMVVHAMRDNYDVAVVVSGDRDFIPAIQEIQAAGKRVEVAAFTTSSAKEMVRQSDKFIALDEFPLLMMSNPVERSETEVSRWISWNSRRR